MKNIFILVLTVFLFFSCTTDELETQKIEIENTVNIQKTAVPDGKIFGVKYRSGLSEHRKQEIRDKYFSTCERPHLVCNDLLSIKMHHRDLADVNVEYWLVVNCLTGKGPTCPGGILTGDDDVDPFQ